MSRWLFIAKAEPGDFNKLRVFLNLSFADLGLQIEALGFVF